MSKAGEAVKKATYNELLNDMMWFVINNYSLTTDMKRFLIYTISYAREGVGVGDLQVQLVMSEMLAFIGVDEKGLSFIVAKLKLENFIEFDIIDLDDFDGEKMLDITLLPERFKQDEVDNEQPSVPAYYNSPELNAIFKEIRGERAKQNLKFGKQNHKPIEWLPILVEEVGEVSKAVCENYFDFYEDKPDNYREELLQVASVAVSMLECYDRGVKK